MSALKRPICWVRGHLPVTLIEKFRLEGGGRYQIEQKRVYCRRCGKGRR